MDESDVNTAVAAAIATIPTAEHSPAQPKPKPKKKNWPIKRPKKFGRNMRKGSQQKHTKFDWAAYRAAQAIERENTVNGSNPGDTSITATLPKPKSPLKKDLKKENAKLKRENTKLKSTVNEYKMEMKTMKKRNGSLEAENKQLLAKLESTGTSIDSLHAEINLGGNAGAISEKSGEEIGL